MSRLLSWFLNCAYLALLILACPWVVWSALTQGKYREGFAQKLLGRVPRRQSDCRCVWLHAVSVGEVNLLQTTLAMLKQQHPDWEFVISTTTKTGYELACRKYGQHTVFYCPLDFSWATANALHRVRPDVLVLAELELWPNLIRMANSHGAKVAIINGRLSDSSFRGYRRFRTLVTHLLRQIDLIAAQNEETAERFRKLGADHVVVTGSLKFDGAITSRENPRTQELKQLANISADDIVLLFGSTQAPEEQYAIDTFGALTKDYANLRLVIVPRHPERFDEVANLLQRSGITWSRRSTFETRASPCRHPQAAILVDSIGELGAWWGTAAIGFVGGSFGSRGGQNMLEPAAYGVATCFGPNTRNFRDIVAQLLAVRGAQVVESPDELEQFVRRALDDPEWSKQLGIRARHLVVQQQGATQRTVDLLRPLVEDSNAVLRNKAA